MNTLKFPEPGTAIFLIRLFAGDLLQLAQGGPAAEARPVRVFAVDGDATLHLAEPGVGEPEGAVVAARLEPGDVFSLHVNGWEFGMTGRTAPRRLDLLISGGPVRRGD